MIFRTLAKALGLLAWAVAVGLVLLMLLVVIAFCEWQYTGVAALAADILVLAAVLLMFLAWSTPNERKR